MDIDTLQEVLFQLSWIDRPILNGNRFKYRSRKYSEGYKKALEHCIDVVKVMITEAQIKEAVKIRSKQ